MMRSSPHAVLELEVCSRDYFLGTRPTGQFTDNQVGLAEVVRKREEPLHINDEACRMHDETHGAVLGVEK